ncbi:unnamed protein product [Citrullus colocynthis]|uniref:TF-B3 domain-containing protein n=1 Tax=Citrullus colocynthis TaxID=252529 RepID=A0ABP0ZAA7_9ROSI
MVKVRYTYNNKIVEKDVYETALIICDIKSKSMEPFELMELIRRLKTRFPGSTSTTSIVNEQPPVINNNPNVAVVPGGARDRILQLLPGGALDRLPPVAVIRNVIGMCSRAFVKQLTKSDLTDGLGRLALHKEFVNRDLVPMFDDNEDLVEGIDVIAFDSEGRQYDMTFKLWTSKLYVLTKSWKEFYKTNNLTQAGEYVTVWMFRHVVNHNLCFAIIQGRFERP